MDTKGGKGGGSGGGGMNWAIGIDMYTLMCIKWMTNKNLLYKKINKIKFKNSKKKKRKSKSLIAPPALCLRSHFPLGQKFSEELTKSFLSAGRSVIPSL